MDSLFQLARDALSDRFLLEGELGVGGGGRVFLARDLRHDRQVAIKVLHPELASAIGPERFVREIRMLASMMHPNILPLFDSGTAGGITWFAMARASGGTLRDRLRASPQLPTDEAVRIAAAIADGLDSAHRQGVVHRDVKPENILFEGDRPLLTDFGIARTLPGADALTVTLATNALGTPAYMSPEQISAETKVTTATDQYGLACVLFEMLGGRVPFPGSTANSILQQHLSAPPPNVRDLRSGVPQTLAAALQRGLAKAPADRFAGMREFRDAIVSGAQDSGAVAGRVRRRRRALIAASVAAAGLAVVLLVLHPWSAPGAHPIRSVAVLPLANVSGDPEEEYFADGMTEELILELSKISALRVISRTSVMSLKGKGLSLGDAGRKLKVDAVLEGTIARGENLLRVNLRLFRVRPEGQLWGESYVRPATSVLGLQSEIARAVATPIRVEVTPAERERLATRHQVPAAAHEAFLRGNFALGIFDASHLQEALERFKAAISIDPQYAAAWAKLAQTYYVMSNMYLPPRTAMEQVRAAARQALALDPELASGHAMMGAVLGQYDWKFDEAEHEYRAGLALDPSDSDAHFYLAYALLETKRLAESQREFDMALELDPLNAYKAAFAAYACYCRRDYPAAQQRYHDLLVSNPKDAMARYSLCLIALAQGRVDEAISSLEPMIDSSETTFPIALLGHAYGRRGRKADAERMLARLREREKSEHVRPTDYGLVYVGMGEFDRALSWYERAYEERDENLLSGLADPILDPLRGQERYRRLMLRLGIPSPGETRAKTSAARSGEGGVALASAANPG